VPNEQELEKAIQDLRTLGNRQVEIFDRLRQVEDRIHVLMERTRKCEDRISTLEKTAPGRTPSH